MCVCVSVSAMCQVDPFEATYVCAAIKMPLAEFQRVKQYVRVYMRVCLCVACSAFVRHELCVLFHLSPPPRIVAASCAASKMYLAFFSPFF